MNDVRKMGRVTIPTDTDAVSETLDLLKRWGADAIRDCDGTEFPQELKDTGAKIYATYYTTRKDNAWAKANPDETQQCYIMTPFYTAEGGALTIPLMTGISRELMKVNDHDDIARWWEVMDRTTGEPVPTADWHYDAASESVVIDTPAAFLFFAMTAMWCMLLMAGVNPWVGTVPALAYGLSTYFLLIIGAGHVTKMWALVYAPLMMGGAWLTLRSNMWLGGALTALFASLEIGANHPQITYYFLLAMAALWISEGIVAFRKKHLPSFARRTAVLLGAGILAVG